MFPTIVMMQAKVDLDEWPPFRALGFADQMHARFGRSMIPFAGVALDARADNILPRCRPAAVPRNDMVKV